VLVRMPAGNVNLLEGDAVVDTIRHNSHAETPRFRDCSGSPAGLTGTIGAEA
jgi:hypothetical protein